MADRHPPVPDAAVNLAGGVYGTLLVTSLIAAFTEDEHVGAGEILVSVFLTVVVFWVAHVYADVLAGAVAAHQTVRPRDILAAMNHEWPIVEAAIGPCLALAMGASGPLSDDAAFDLALAIGVTSMAAWGLVVGRSTGLGRFATAVTAVLSAAMGLVVVALKVLVE